MALFSRRARSGDGRVLTERFTSPSPNAGPDEGADVVCASVDELRAALAEGAHPVWAGHPDTLVQVGDGVRLSVRGLGRVVAVGTGQVWAFDEGGVSGYDDCLVHLDGLAQAGVSDRATVVATGLSRVMAASVLGDRRPDTGELSRAERVSVTLRGAAYLQGAPVNATVLAQDRSNVVIDGIQADLEIELHDRAIASVGARPQDRVSLVCHDDSYAAVRSARVTARDRSRVFLEGEQVPADLDVDGAEDVRISWNPDLPGLGLVRPGLTTLPPAALSELTAWLEFFHHDAVASPEPDTVRLYQALSLTAPKPLQVGMKYSQPMPPNAVLPAGRELIRLTAAPHLAHPCGPFLPVALDLPRADIRARSEPYLPHFAAAALSRPTRVIAVNLDGSPLPEGTDPYSGLPA